jgi:hypothetical protein
MPVTRRLETTAHNPVAAFQDTERYCSDRLDGLLRGPEQEPATYALPACPDADRHAWPEDLAACNGHSFHLATSTRSIPGDWPISRGELGLRGLLRETMLTVVSGGRSSVEVACQIRWTLRMTPWRTTGRSGDRSLSWRRCHSTPRVPPCGPSLATRAIIASSTSGPNPTGALRRLPRHRPLSSRCRSSSHGLDPLRRTD